MKLSLQFIILILVLTSIRPNVLGQEVACSDKGALLYNGYCFQEFSNKALNRNEAQFECKNWGGDLAKIESFELANAAFNKWQRLSHWIGLTFFNDAWIWLSDNSPVSLDTYLLDNFQTNIEHWPACGCVSIHNDIYGFYMMERECSNTLYFLCMRPAIKIFTTNVESSTNTTHFSVTSKRPNNEKQVAEDKGKQGDEDKGKQAAEEKGKQVAEDKGKQGDEDKGKQGDEDKGKQAAEEKGKQAAEDKGKQGDEDKGKQAAEEKGKQAAEEKGKQAAEDKGKQGADDKGKQD